MSQSEKCLSGAEENASPADEEARERTVEVSIVAQCQFSDSRAVFLEHTTTFSFSLSTTQTQNTTGNVCLHNAVVYWHTKRSSASNGKTKKKKKKKSQRDKSSAQFSGDPLQTVSSAFALPHSHLFRLLF